MEQRYICLLSREMLIIKSANSRLAGFFCLANCRTSRSNQSRAFVNRLD